MRLGVIDLGTNSIRVFVFKHSADKPPTLLYQEKIMVRLGDGVFETGELNQAAMLRTRAAFLTFKEVLDEYGVKNIRAVATSAMRVAKNSAEFTQKVLEESGILIETIEADTEASFIAQGVVRNLILPEIPLLLIDMGGGSTEISLCRGDKILISKSLPLGAARGQQNFLKTVPPCPEGEELLRSRVTELLEEAFPDPPFAKAKVAIGSSGSIRAFGKIYESNTTRNKIFTRRFLKDAIADLSSYSRDELLEVPGLEPRRVDLITAAGIILHQVMKHFNTKVIEVTKFALKDGVVLELCQPE